MNYYSLNGLSARDNIINVHVFCLIQVMIYCLYDMFGFRKTNTVANIIKVFFSNQRRRSYIAFVLSEVKKAESPILHFSFAFIRGEETIISYIAFFIRGEDSRISYIALFVFCCSGAKKAEYTI